MVLKFFIFKNKKQSIGNFFFCFRAEDPYRLCLRENKNDRISNGDDDEDMILVCLINTIDIFRLMKCGLGL